MSKPLNARSTKFVKSRPARERLLARSRSSQSGGSTTKPSREGNAVECGLIVIPTAGQRDPTSVGMVKLLLSPAGGNG